MSIAANAVADIAPPPSQAGANARADRRGDTAFQDHLDAADHEIGNEPRTESRPAPGNGSPRQETRAGTSADETDVRTQTSASEASNDSGPTKPRSDNEDAEAAAPDQQVPPHPPVLIQLIANAPVVLGAKSDEPTATKPNSPVATPTPEETQLAAIAAGPTNLAPKSSGPSRPQHTPKHTGSAPVKDTPASASGETLKQSGPDMAPATAPEANAAPSLAPTAAQGAGHGGDNVKEQALEASVDSKSRAAPPREPASAPATPVIAPEEKPTQRGVDTPKATPRETMKALAQEVLKQIAQDTTPPAPKAQPAPSASPAATHLQLAASTQQAASSEAAMRTTPPAAAQIGGEIIRRFNGQDTSFQMRLDPPELGRVDVRLDVSRDHRVTATISADTPQALSDLAHGARDLQQALQSAGLDLADDGLRFNLSSNGQGNAFAQARAQQDQPNYRPAIAPEIPIPPEPVASRPLSLDSWRGARVDLVA